MKDRVYLGDAVYAQHDGYAVVLTTEDGIRATNTIYLEPEVLGCFMGWLEMLRASRAEQAGGGQ